jgi:hypothetical protein
VDCQATVVHKRIGSQNAKWLFWLLLALILLLNLPRLLASPMRFNGRDHSPVIITEFLARNQTGLTDDEDQAVDWIELYNRSSTAVDLTGWSLTDNVDLPDKWQFPPVTLAPQQYLIVFASGKNGFTLPNTTDDATAPPILHTNFRLSGAGGFLALYPPTSRRFVDGYGITYGPQRVDVAYGRTLDRGMEQGAIPYYFFAQPTPGAANDLASMQPAAAAPVQFSHRHGLYDAPFALALTSATADAELWYTTDGALPTPETALRYGDPIVITTTTVIRAIAVAEGLTPAAPTTQSYLFPAAVLAQAAAPATMPTTWGTHRLTFAGATAGDPVQADYAMDPRIAQDEQYQPQLLQGLRDLPSLALTLPPAAFAALYSDPQTRGVETEQAVAVELLPTADEAGFQLDAGLRIQGGAGRWEYMPKHSFRLFFKGTYGATKLTYPFFPDSPVTEFDTLVLRAGVDRSFAGHPDTPDLRQTTYARDEWVRTSQIAMGSAGAHGRFVHLYINGLYWGLYNVVERPDASFAAAYYGGDKEEWAAVNHGGAVSGQFDRFGTLVRLAQEGGLADPAAYATMLEFIDPVQFSDYLIVNWYAGNTDWPENNWYANVQYPAGRNLFFVWDAENTWDTGALIHLGVDQVAGAPFPNVVKLVFGALWENADFRLLFADRLYHHLSTAGSLSPAAAQARWQAITAPLTNAIIAESARWGDVRYDPPITQADWARATAAVATQMADNANQLLTLTRAAGYYPVIDPPQFVESTPTFTDATTVALRTEQPLEAVAEIYYTVDGSDPRQAVSGEIAPTALHYTAPFTLTTSTTVRTRLRTTIGGGVTWSAVAVQPFLREGERADVRITEIMYHAQDGADYEYIEFKNVGELPADLSRAYLAGITYRFPVDAVLAPGAHYVLIRDFRKFRERYPEAEFNGIYSGELSNYGETVALHDRRGDVITSTTYRPADGWPVTAAGDGDAVILHTLTGDPNAGSSWRASRDRYGSPGRDDSEDGL